MIFYFVFVFVYIYFEYYNVDVYVKQVIFLNLVYVSSKVNVNFSKLNK